MRTTIDLPPDLDAIARSIAHDERRSLSSVLVDLVRRGLTPRPVEDGPLPTRNGIPQFRLSRPITMEDVRKAQDDE